MKLYDPIHRPYMSKLGSFVLDVHPLAWYSAFAIVGLVLGLIIRFVR